MAVLAPFIRFVGTVLVTFAGIFGDTLYATFIISSHVITQSSTVLAK